MKKILKVKDYLLEVLDGVEGIPSFELARMVDKRHDHVLVAIRNEVNIYKKFKPDINKDIIPYWYTGKNNQSTKAYFLTERGIEIMLRRWVGRTKDKKQIKKGSK